MECIMHPGKELGQCVDIDECTASVLYLTPCFALLKYCRSSHHQTSWVFLLKHLLQDPRFIDASLAYCGQNTTCTNRSNDKTSLYFQTKGIHCYEKKSHTKILTLLILQHWLVLVPLQPRIHRFPRRGVKFCLLCCHDAKLPIANFFPWTSL